MTQNANTLIPVIAIDGPTASGKGTVAQLIAERLGYHYLDSGALYRLVGLASLKVGVSTASEVDLIPITENLNVNFCCRRKSLKISYKCARKQQYTSG